MGNKNSNNANRITFDLQDLGVEPKSAVAGNVNDDRENFICGFQNCINVKVGILSGALM